MQYKIKKKKKNSAWIYSMLRLQCSKNISSDVLLLLEVGTVHKTALFGGQVSKMTYVTCNFS